MRTDADAHRLLAILSGDGVGYSLLVSRDERAALAALDAARIAFREAVEGESGRIVDTAGDSVLAVFGTAAGALRAAVDAQRRLGAAAGHDALRFRIGLHLGDVIEKADGTVYGEGVNVAARLQAIAEPGGIVVSQALRSSVPRRVHADFDDLGVQRLKNIGDPVHSYRIASSGTRSPPRRRIEIAVAAGAASIAVALAAALSWRDKPAPVSFIDRLVPPQDRALIGQSVAVLGFEPAAGQADRDSFAAGVGDELTTMLSRVPGLRVAARSSAAHAKTQGGRPSEVARRLGVRYLVTGLGRQDGQRIRLDVQLVDASTDQPVWSRRYERPIEDIFAIQTEIATSILNNLRLKITQAELVGSGTANPEARRLFLQAQQIHAENPATNVVEPLLQTAIRLDPEFVRARLMLHEVRVSAGRFTFGNRNDPALLATIQDAAQIAARHPTLFEAHSTLWLALSAGWRFEEAAEAERRALAVGDETAQAVLLRARAAARDGRMADALAAMEQSLEADPLSADAMTEGARLMLLAGRNGRALDLAERALDLSPNARYTLALKSVAQVRLGRKEAALRTVQAIDGGPLTTFFGVATVSALGDREGLVERLRQVERTERHSFFHVYLLLHLGEHERAMDELRVQDLNTGDFFLRMQYDPAWDPLRGTDRFRAILRTLGVEAQHDRAQAWRSRPSEATTLGSERVGPLQQRGVVGARAASS